MTSTGDDWWSACVAANSLRLPLVRHKQCCTSWKSDTQHQQQYAVLCEYANMAANVACGIWHVCGRVSYWTVMDFRSRLQSIALPVDHIHPILYCNCLQRANSAIFFFTILQHACTTRQLEKYQCADGESTQTSEAASLPPHWPVNCSLTSTQKQWTVECHCCCHIALNYTASGRAKWARSLKRRCAGSCQACNCQRTQL